MTRKNSVFNRLLSTVTILSFVVYYPAFSIADSNTKPTAKNINFAELACEDALRKRTSEAFRLFVKKYPPKYFKTACSALAQTGVVDATDGGNASGLPAFSSRPPGLSPPPPPPAPPAPTKNPPPPPPPPPPTGVGGEGGEGSNMSVVR